MSFDPAVAAHGAAKATQDVAAASQQIALANERYTQLMEAATLAKLRSDRDALFSLIKQADVVARDMVLSRALYQKAVEVAALVQSVATLSERAMQKRASGDQKGAHIDEQASAVAAEALKVLSSSKIPIKLPPMTADAVISTLPPARTSARPNGLGALGFFDIGAMFNEIGKKVGDVANWVTDNGPLVGGAVGGVVGSIVPGAGTAVGASVGSALGAVMTAAKPAIVGQAPPPPAPGKVTAVVQPKPSPTSPAPVAVVTQPSTPAFNDPTAQVAASGGSSGLMNNPLMLVGAGALGLGLIGAAVALKRR